MRGQEDGMGAYVHDVTGPQMGYAFAMLVQLFVGGGSVGRMGAALQ